MDVPQGRASASIPYVAVSYTWDPNPVHLQWHGRRVTTQALDIAKRLASRTSYPLWIDAICIPQDHPEVKEEELPKMADIYRGAVAVVCLVSGIGPVTCEVVRRGVQMTDTEAYRDLETAGDIYGSYMFATAGGNAALRSLFEHRWWERAWTFQETVLNRQTYLVGDADDSIPIDDALRIALVVRRRAASALHLEPVVLGRPPAFWDSVSVMAVAAKRALSLGEAVACVWRRDATERHELVYAMVGVCGLATSVTPSYSTPFDTIIRELFDAAVSVGDYSWIPWCTEIDQKKGGEGMGLVPTPELVRASEFTSITSWRSIPVPSEIPQFEGVPTGVLLPFRSTGVILSQSPPMFLPETVAYLRKLGYIPAEIWDMLFGAQVGLMADVARAVGNDGIAEPALNCALAMIAGEQSRTSAASDMSGALPHTKGISFMSYSVMAAETWTRTCDEAGRTRLLSVVSSQGGTAVVPYEGLSSFESSSPSQTPSGRIHILPVEPSGVGSKSRRYVFVTAGDAPWRAYATAVMVHKASAGSGKWQLRRVG